MTLNDPNRAPPDQKIWLSWLRAPLSMALMAVALAMAVSTWLITRTTNHAVDRMGDFLIPQVNSTTLLGGSVNVNAAQKL